VSKGEVSARNVCPSLHEGLGGSPLPRACASWSSGRRHPASRTEARRSAGRRESAPPGTPKRKFLSLVIPSHRGRLDTPARAGVACLRHQAHQTANPVHHVSGSHRQGGREVEGRAEAPCPRANPVKPLPGRKAAEGTAYGSVAKDGLDDGDVRAYLGEPGRNGPPDVM
jgi:hypothetical protein